MLFEVPVDKYVGVVDGLQLVSQAYPTHALLDSSPVRMLASPYEYPLIEGIRLRCFHCEDECVVIHKHKFRAYGSVSQTVGRAL
ncbi:hypothetical protein TNCV_2167341 [Trichonephila clavipes]|nr:hypothetical protein TNCV_2167341 [Trichonephila clavipes]